MQGFQTVNTKFKMRTYKYVPKRVFLALVLILIVVFSSKLIFNAFLSYPCVPDDQIMSVLLHKTTPSVENLTDLRPACDYRKLVYENDNFYESIFYLNVSNFDGIQSGGEFTPSHCKPEFSTAIIIPYRNRITQLNRFIAYIHHFLRQQHIHYRIFVIEQADDKPFNRAKLFNVGAVYAINSKFPCLIFHDVDLIPLQLGNLYACAKLPRHMAVNMNKYQYKLPYKRYVGGSISIPAEIYQTINGMSNLYFGWGGEDDDLYERLQRKHIELLRFGPNYSQYNMMRHEPETPSDERHKLLNNAVGRIESDGLNSLEYKETNTSLAPLYTHIFVEL